MCGCRSFFFRVKEAIPANLVLVLQRKFREVKDLEQDLKLQLK